MAVNVFPVPSVSTSPIKSIQRGSASSAGSITISSVVTKKTFVRGFSNGSAGSAGATGTDSGTLSPSGGNDPKREGGTLTTSRGGMPSYVGTRTFAAGATDLTSAEFGVYLVDSTTITVTGACYYEIIEYI